MASSELPSACSRASEAACRLAVLLVGCWGAATGAARADAFLHTGRFADGAIVKEGPLVRWHAADAQPSFADRAILDPGNPLRWAIRVQRARATAAVQPLPMGPFVEFVTGDRLPGVVEGYNSGRETLGERLPPHLLVRPAGPPVAPGQPVPPPLRVRTDLVSRVVREPSGRAAKPSTLRLSDGREVEFNSLRWMQQAAFVLTAAGPARFGFEEIAEIRMPPVDPWASFYGVVAVIAPDATDRLVRYETADGLIATTAVRRILASGSENDPNSWEHRIESAWSLDPIRVRHASVDARWFFSPHEVPLPLIDATRVERRAVFGGAWNWERNRSVRGTPLAVAGQPYGWGFGVQATCDLCFPLPAIATGFRCGVALDDAAGSGGCARARVSLDSAGASPLWQSGFMVGPAEPGDTGLVSLQAKPDGTSLLVLSADDAHQGRPAGADPFDIRDAVDWLDPVVVLDSAGLAEAVRARLPGTIPAWEDWSLSLPPGSTLAVRDVVTPAGCARLVGPTAGELVLKRSLTVDDRTPFLLVGASRSAGASGSRVEVRIDGKLMAAGDLPERPAGGLPAPFRFPLERFKGRAIAVEVAHVPSDANGLVEWHALAATGPASPSADPPGILLPEVQPAPAP